MKASSKPVAVITGASAGIGAAAARALIENGFDVVLGARRLDPMLRITEAVGGRALRLDVADPASVDAFAGELERVDLLVNNAGFGLGLEPVAEADLEDWRRMLETNVVGLGRVTQALLPRLEASGAGHVINIGSIAGFETYAGGAGYTASKHAVRAITRTLRLELLGKPVRVTEICPGMVETEFSVVRFRGDRERADAVYDGMTPLRPEDIADCIVWAATRPPWVNIDEIVVRPLDQATAHHVHRQAPEEG